MQFVGYVVAHGETAAVLGSNPARLPVRVGSLADKLFQICTTEVRWEILRLICL